MTMSDRRLEQLLEKELDGELTRLEKEELERLVASDPNARRERAAWRRVTRVLGEEDRSAGKIDVDEMAERILARVSSESASARREAEVELEPRPAKIELMRFRRALIISSAIAAGVIVLWAGSLATHLRAPRVLPDVATATSAPVEAHARSSVEPKPKRGKAAMTTPVEIWLGDATGKEDREFAPVNIRF